MTSTTAMRETGMPSTTARAPSSDIEDRLHVLDGSIDLWIGDTRLRLCAGSWAALPRGIAHGFNSVAPNTRVMLEQG